MKFYVKSGTIDELIAKGRNARPGPTPKLVKEHFGDFIHGGRGWNKEFVRFKVESNANIPLPQVNIQLGNGKGVDIFNKNMLFFEKIN